MLASIKENLKNNKIKTVLKSLYDMATDLSDSEFYDIVDETFIFDPELFMNKIYKDFMEKMGKMIGVQKRQEMERYIIKKYCLAENEKILYELKGNIFLREGEEIPEYRAVKFSINSADIFITNKRMIVNGKLKVEGGAKKEGFLSGLLYDLLPKFPSPVFPRGSKRRKERKQALVESSPVFGYQFPTKIPKTLFKKKQTVGYFANINKHHYTFIIKPSDKSKRGEHISNIFDILRKDVDETLAIIQEIYEKDEIFIDLKNNKQKRILSVLSSLFRSQKFLHLKFEDLTHLSDSDKMKIITETYKLDPEYFVTSIYPKMASWDFPSFLSLKEELFELLRKEGASI